MEEDPMESLSGDASYNSVAMQNKSRGLIE